MLGHGKPPLPAGKIFLGRGIEPDYVELRLATGAG
jgi:hypothetical protein